MPPQSRDALAMNRLETEFANEAPLDFSREEARASFKEALRAVRQRLPIECPLLIGGQKVETEAKIKSENPSNTVETVAISASAGPAEAERAIALAREAFPAWAEMDANARASILERWADLIREHRAELSAIEILEEGKPWREADGDICEAIDFLDYYAREMRLLAEPVHLQQSLLGEVNEYGYEALGVVSVIAPWNFPLAIPVGMVSAALVAGNTVLFKPSEQAPGIGYRMVELAHQAGVPGNVLHYLPGEGEKVGPTLVEHPDVDMIVFTGSKEVGCKIFASAAAKPGKRGLKRVVAEMGGKNAIIVDADADIDAAAPDILSSAFGYAGQKCSACSRVIVLKSIAEALFRRLGRAAESVAVGPAEEPLTVVGPLIEKSARERLERAMQLGDREALCLYKGKVTDLAKKGHFVAPSIYVDAAPQSDLMQKEFFGPLLACATAENLDEAIAMANSTAFALTGGIHSRSPSRIREAKRRVQVGNFYINRGVTGAIVGRQPFGGFRFSGIGSKAGGPDYLKQFLVARTWTENIVRQGFAPMEPAGGAKKEKAPLAASDGGVAGGEHASPAREATRKKAETSVGSKEKPSGKKDR
jgi:RHH-type proline utilization regulon transcriptional repressor/proline dehydrogenase/delta 1-pyrroline-5-carboxylate dehydrogenase